MLSAKFKAKTTAAVSRGSLATAQLSCFARVESRRMKAGARDTSYSDDRIV